MQKLAMRPARRILTASLLATTILGAAAAQASPNYNGGPVIGGTPDVYFIWYGNWGTNSAKSILPSFVQTLGGTAYLGTETTMAGDGLVAYDGSTSISSSLNKSLYFGGLKNPSSQIQSIVQNVLAHGLLPNDPLGIYDVLTAPGLSVSGFNTKFCGFHGSTNWGLGSLGTQYGLIGDPTASQTGCHIQSGSPNGNLGADAMASVIAHELIETVTDPTGIAWWDSDRRSSTYGNEAADMCAWNFGTTNVTASGARYNYTSSTGANYLLQQQWVNTGGGLGYTGGQCGMSAGVAAAFAMAGGSGLDGARSDPVQAPEPSTSSLVGFALAGFAVLRRRRKKAMCAWRVAFRNAGGSNSIGSFFLERRLRLSRCGIGFRAICTLVEPTISQCDTAPRPSLLRWHESAPIGPPEGQGRSSRVRVRGTHQARSRH